jgi:hypothetical protein
MNALVNVLYDGKAAKSVDAANPWAGTLESRYGFHRLENPGN